MALADVVLVLASLLVGVLGAGLLAAAVALVWARAAEAAEARRQAEDVEIVRRTTGRDPER